VALRKRPSALSAALKQQRDITLNATEEIKLDGYRLEAMRNTKEVTLYSRRRNVLNDRFGYIATALEYLPAGTVVDGEVVGLGPDGHADFYLLQKFRTAQSNIVYYAFDILVHEHRDLTRLPLSERREILATVVRPDKHVALSVASNRPAAEMLEFAKTHGLEDLVAKRADSVYHLDKEPISGANTASTWDRNLSLADMFPVISVSIRSPWAFHRGRDPIYSARVRAGFVPRTRREVFETIRHLKIAKCPFVNLPETEPGRWGQGLTAEKIKECIWLLCRIRHRTHWTKPLRGTR
jgi:hypothetical protein